jgi:hypothetical protein
MDDVAFDYGLDAFAWNNCVHVRAHHDGVGSRDRAFESRYDISGISSYFFTCVVYLDDGAHLFAIRLNTLSDVTFFARVTVDLYEFEQEILDSFLIDHLSSVAERDKKYSVG